MASLPSAQAPPGAGPPGRPQPTHPWRPRSLWGRVAPRSLTARLVSGVVVLVVLVVAITGGTTYALLRPFLIERLDKQVGPTADANVGQMRRCDERGLEFSGCLLGNNGGFRAPQPQWIALIIGNAELPIRVQNGASNDYAVMNLSPSDVSRLVADSSPRTLTTTDGKVLRVAVREVRPGFLVVTGLSTAEDERTLRRLLRLESGIGAGSVVLALLLTLYGVRFGLRPLYRVTRTAREVSAELSAEGAGLDRRVPVTETTTEVGQLAGSFNTMLGAVETQFAARLESEARMRQFLADASHELRTPLTTIRGYAELARMRRRQGIEDEADTLDRIESEGTRMSRLVDDLLTLARSDQGSAPASERVEIADVAEEVVDGARAAHPDFDIDFFVPDGLVVLADRDQLVRAVRNLVTNGAVHTAPRGPIRVHANRVDAWIELRVTDGGPGLPPGDAALVFERFWRADKARTRVRGGSGLGLAIVRSIVESHGGSVRFESSVPDGSVVTIRLPAA